MMLRIGRCEATSGFLLLTALLYYLDDQGILPWALCGCALHELGHFCVIRLLGGRVTGLRLSAAGAEMFLSTRVHLGHGRQMLSALAGPGTNLFCVLLALWVGSHFDEGAFLFAGLSLSLACVNLLPIAQLDGGRALYHLVCLLWSESLGEKIVQISSVVTVAVLLLAGAALLWRTERNFTLMLTALWLAAALKTRGMEGKRGRRIEKWLSF